MSYSFNGTRYHTAQSCADAVVSEYVYVSGVCPLHILEQNTDAGLTNQIVSDWRLQITTDDVLNGVRRFRSHLIAGH